MTTADTPTTPETAAPASTDLDFDSLIATSDTAAVADDFDSLVSSSTPDDDGPTLAALALREQVSSDDFGVLNVEDFAAFNASDYTPEAGEYIFSVEQKYLKEATRTTGNTVSKTAAQFGAVKVALLKDKEGRDFMRLQTFAQSAFSEQLIPLPQAVNPALDPNKPVAFVMDHSVLAKIADKFPDAVITFKFLADKKLLVIEQDKTKLEIGTFERTDFTEYHSKIGEPQMKGKVNPTLLRNGVKFLQNFTRKDDIQANLSLIEFRDSEIVGGTLSALGVFSSELIGDLTMKVKYEAIQTFEKMLSRFNPENTYLFETDSFYILRDETLYFGFEATKHSFPATAQFFKIASEENVLIPRVQLLNSLFKLSVVNVDRDLTVNMALDGIGHDAVLTLTTEDASGKKSRDELKVTRRANEGADPSFEPWDINVNITGLIKVVGHFDTANVELELLAKKALLVLDEGEQYKASTILALQSEEQIAKRKAARSASATKAEAKEAA